MNNISEYSRFLDGLTEKIRSNDNIEAEYYEKYKVKRGLRNENGTGVLVGLTRIGSVVGYRMENNQKYSVEGELYYRGINVKDLVKGFQAENRRGFEETAYLLLCGELPTEQELNEFNKVLDECRELPRGFTENMILKIPSRDIMNGLQRSTLALYSHDDDPENITVSKVLRQSIELIARFPTIISYAYQAKAHNFDGKSLYIHSPKPGIGTAENILHMIRPDNSYTRVEAETLDLCMVIHSDHGAGNNSSFATHVVSSSGTDTYSAIAAAVGCLKGPKHGGANIMVRNMVKNILENVTDWNNREKLKDYLYKIIKKEAYDRKGLIYGMGHAVYTLSDPRALMLKKKAYELAVEKDAVQEYKLYKNIEELSIEIFKSLKGEDTVIPANVDLYSGFVYDKLRIPCELYTPIFAASRVAGWCAHRIETVVGDNRIIRPAYVNVNPRMEYVPISDR
ncbi:MAG: citrate/2-methylcitrate synthase [Clostridiaceae bacterium]|jgi:citrate synthase|nr:citrate/2-methylcitrate synthase [Clostridiaceae bacterium]